MENNIVERIRKILRLARDKGASEAEAATALAMAQRLMLQHNIQNLDEGEEQAAAKWGKWMGVRFKRKWELLLLSPIAKLYSCRVVVSKLDGDVQFAGAEENIAVCEETLRMVHEQVNRLHKEALAAFRGRMGKLDKIHYRHFRATFKEACVLRIIHRVNDIVAAARNEIPAHKALVVIDQALASADDLLSMAKVPPGKSIKPHKSSFGTGAGWAAGDLVKLQEAASHGMQYDAHVKAFYAWQSRKRIA